MLKVHDGAIQYGDEVLLNRLNLEILPKHVTCILGPNGSGKTTLLKVFSKHMILHSGTLLSTFTRPILIPQYIYVPHGLTVEEYVSSVLYRSHWKWFLTTSEKTSVHDVLQKLGLYNKKDKDINQLSAGEIHLANIALALVYGADLIMLDEPTAHLDLVNQVLVCDILTELARQGYAVVVVMHDINMALKYCDRFVVMQQDKTVVYGDRETILQNDALVNSFGINFTMVNNGKNFLVCPDI